MPRHTAPEARHILAADIGGTNSRFGHFTLSPDGALALVSSVWLPTTDVDSFVELLERLPQTGFTLPLFRAEAAVFAVPGAVVGRKVNFANIDWTLDLDDLIPVFGQAHTTCVNDFLAQAHGCRLLGQDAEEVLPGAMDPTRVQAVIGAGTGLGHAALAPLDDTGNNYQVLPSEKGHATASFFGEEETAFADYLCHRTGERYVRGDTVLSGSGLAHLHRFLTGEDLTPAEVGSSLTRESRTTALFARFYGRATRDYVLTVLATGGVYVSGGVAAKNPLLVTHPEFSREFLDSPTYGDLLKNIAVRLVRDEQTGLFGAAWVAARLLVQSS